MKVHVLLILAVIATAAVVTVKCNYTLASAVTEEMMKDLETKTKSWTHFGKEKIQESLGLNHHDSRYSTSDKKEEANTNQEETNISKKSKSEICHTTNDAQGNSNKKCGILKKKTYETTKLNNNDVNDFTHKVSSLKNKISEKAGGLKEQAYEAVKTLKDGAIKKAQNVKEKVQEIVGEPIANGEGYKTKEG